MISGQHGGRTDGGSPHIYITPRWPTQRIADSHSSFQLCLLTAAQCDNGCDPKVLLDLNRLFEKRNDTQLDSQLGDIFCHQVSHLMSSEARWSGFQYPGSGLRQNLTSDGSDRCYPESLLRWKQLNIETLHKS